MTEESYIVEYVVGSVSVVATALFGFLRWYVKRKEALPAETEEALAERYKDRSEAQGLLRQAINKLEEYGATRIAVMRVTATGKLSMLAEDYRNPSEPIMAFVKDVAVDEQFEKTMKSLKDSHTGELFIMTSRLQEAAFLHTMMTANGVITSYMKMVEEHEDLTIYVSIDFTDVDGEVDVCDPGEEVSIPGNSSASKVRFFGGTLAAKLKGVYT